MSETTVVATTAFFSSSDGQRIDPDSTCTIGGESRPVPERGLSGYRIAVHRMWAALAQRGYEPATNHYDDMRVVPGGVEMDIRPLTVTLYKSNSDSVYVGAGQRVWDLGRNAEAGAFASDARAWFVEESQDCVWGPREVIAMSAQDQGLTPVATWDVFHGVRLLVAPEHLGGAAEEYLGLSA
ncbi:hypothetical protein [Micromonospora sp. NPDC005652]|uniref:hypothetical protein n=1 Tax=Micromonospora sp. NPDC005652 TaxID=3157046 RepID=UPI0033C2E165